MPSEPFPAHLPGEPATLRISLPESLGARLFYVIKLLHVVTNHPVVFCGNDGAIGGRVLLVTYVHTISDVETKVLPALRRLAVLDAAEVRVVEGHALVRVHPDVC